MGCEFQFKFAYCDTAARAINETQTNIKRSSLLRRIVFVRRSRANKIPSAIGSSRVNVLNQIVWFRGWANT
jgi:hypothetical protein